MPKHPFSHIKVKGPGVHFARIDARRCPERTRTWAEEAKRVLLESDPDLARRLQDKEVHVHFLSQPEFGRITRDPGATSATLLEEREHLRAHILINADHMRPNPSRAFPVMLFELSSNAPYIAQRTRELARAPDQASVQRRHDREALTTSVETLNRVLEHPDLKANGRHFNMRGLVEVSRDVDEEALRGR